MNAAPQMVLFCGSRPWLLAPEFAFAYDRGGTGTAHMIRTAEAECVQARER